MSPRLLLIALVCCLAFPCASLAAAGDPLLDADERAFCKQINSYRAQNGVPALRLSRTLTKAAKAMSADMATKDYFDHTDSLGRSPSRRMSAFGYRGSLRAENIAAGSDGSAATIFGQWKASAEHRKNMLNASYKVIGVGRASNPGSMYGWYWTTKFGNATDRTIAC